MRKLKLSVEELSVESFRVTPWIAEKRGTVQGNSLTEPGSDSYGDDTCGTCGLGGITDYNCVTEPFGGCSDPNMTWGGPGSRPSTDHADEGYC